MSKDTGGPAFLGLTQKEQEGMTLRDYFAGQALQGMVSKTNLQFNDPEGYAINAYLLADAMLAERGRER